MTMKRYCDADQCRCEQVVDVRTRDAAYTFRDDPDPFQVTEEYAVCSVCGEEVFVEEFTNATLKKLSDLYQNKHEINPNMMKEVRKTYGLTQDLFAKLLNIGIATIKRYETGKSAPIQLQAALYKELKKNPERIKHYFMLNKGAFNSEELETVEQRLALYISEENAYKTIMERAIQLTYKEHEKSLDNGQRDFDIGKLFHMILFFAREGVQKTKLMKLLWYSDFLGYKRNKRSISGTPYWHLQYGPVPKKHDLILGSLAGIDLISILEEETPDGFMRINIKAQVNFNADLFTTDEWDIIRYVDEYFKDFGSVRISNFAHKEVAWKLTNEEEIISYQYAESLQLQ